MELKKVPYKVSPLARILMYKLYVSHVNDDPRERVDIAEIGGLFSVPISANLIRSALEVLRVDGFVRRSETKAVGYKFMITHDGIVTVEKALRNRESDLAHFHRFQDDALSELAGPDSTWLTSEERLDEDAWQPLKIDREDPVYIEVIEKVDAAIERIRGDNGFAENEPERRAGILAVLEDGMEWLRTKAPSKKQIVQKLIDPLWAITTRFRDTLMAEAAKAAVAAILRWLDSL